MCVVWCGVCVGQAYSENVAKIARHNADARQTYRKGVNKFTDMDAAARKRFLGFSMAKKLSDYVQARAPTTEEVPAIPLEALPKSVDWRNKKNPSVITPVKDQGMARRSAPQPQQRNGVACDLM